MARGRPKASLVVSPEAREELERYVRRRKTAQHLALRSRIILRCAEGLNNQTVADELRVIAATVYKWRARFIRKGFDGLRDEPSPRVPRTISDSVVEQVNRIWRAF